MNNMNEKYIQHLVERFMAGETSLAEERILYRFFSSTAKVPKSLEQYCDIFRALAMFDLSDDELAETQEKETTVEKKSIKKPMPLRWIAYTVASAAAIILVWLSPVGNSRQNGLNGIYEGSYVMVDNKLIDDQNVVVKKVTETLAWAEMVEREADAIPSTADSESSLLESISDPETRQELEKLLTE